MAALCGQHLALSRGAPGGSSLAIHERVSEFPLGFVLVVGSTAESQVVDRGSSAAGDRHDMVVFEVISCFAPMALRAHEGASTAVALPDCAPRESRNVTKIRGGSCAPRLVRGRELPLLEPRDREVEHSISTAARSPLGMRWLSSSWAY